MQEIHIWGAFWLVFFFSEADICERETVEEEPQSMHVQKIKSQTAKSTVKNGCGGNGTRLGWR